jgi:1-acyl-sn-glycerol-3-phosphate acyltransferase
VKAAPYHLPPRLIAALAWSALRGRPRSFAEDARRALAGLPHPPQVSGLEHLPACGPLLLVTNHYTRPGLGAWWAPILVSATLPYPVHWVTSAAFTFDDRPLLALLTPLTAFALRRIARTYGFTTLPPLPPAPGSPPHPGRARAAALSVRRLLQQVQTDPLLVIGLAPEGRDSPGAALQPPPPGAGRLILRLTRAGMPVLPAGVFEHGPRLGLRLGPPFTLQPPPGLSAPYLDTWASNRVMQALAGLLPAHLHGPFSPGSPAEVRDETPETA